MERIKCQAAVLYNLVHLKYTVALHVHTNNQQALQQYSKYITVDMLFSYRPMGPSARQPPGKAAREALVAKQKIPSKRGRRRSLPTKLRYMRHSMSSTISSVCLSAVRLPQVLKWVYVRKIIRLLYNAPSVCRQFACHLLT